MKIKLSFIIDTYLNRIIVKHIIILSAKLAQIEHTHK